MYKSKVKYLNMEYSKIAAFDESKFMSAVGVDKIIFEKIVNRVRTCPRMLISVHAKKAKKFKLLIKIIKFYYFSKVYNILHFNILQTKIDIHLSPV